jgi:hypothetical protein
MPLASAPGMTDTTPACGIGTISEEQDECGDQRADDVSRIEDPLQSLGTTAR